MKKEVFNVIVAGVGGQGIITLLKILAEASLLEEKEVRTSELHGLSQKGGSVSAHARFGKKVFSPLIEKGEVDLVLALEMAEGLRSASMAGAETKFLVNDKVLAFKDSPKKEEIIKRFEKRKDFYLVPASRICQEKLGKEIVAGVYLLARAHKLGFLPFEEENLIQAVKRTVPEKYFDVNKKAFRLAHEEET